MLVRFAVGCLVLALLAPTAVAQAQDFDPSGRRPRPPPGARPGPRPPRPGPDKGPSVEARIARYTAIVLRQPGAVFPLKRLAELYRERDGKLDGLIAELEKRAAQAGPEQFNARLALAGIYAEARRYDEAVGALEAAAADQPRKAAPKLMLARLAEQRGRAAEARAHYEAALPLVPSGIDKERVIRKLMLLCLDLEDYDQAQRYHQALVRAASGSLFVKKELGSELLSRGKYARAEAEFRKIVQASAGDNRALAPALRDLGKALAKQKKMDEALEVLERARRIAGAQAGIRREILVLLTDVFREQGKLGELEDELGVLRRGADQRLVLVDRLVELPRGLQ